MKLIFYIANTAFQILNRKRYVEFKKSIENPEEAQLKVLQSIINSNKDCEIGKKFSFRKINSAYDFQQLVPLMNYDDYEPFIRRIMAGEKNILCSEEIDYLALSSGTSTPSKYIPYTKTLKKQFNTTLNAWIYDLLKDNPKIKNGSQFWIITPLTTIDQKDSKIPVGFEPDSSYFGVIEKWLINCIMAIPEKIINVKDRENYFYLLCYFLLQKRNLRLISIWNPSLLISITDFLKSNFSVLLNDMIHGTLSLPNPDVKSDYELFRKKIRKNRKRANELIYAMENGSLNIKKIWPNLELISCWTESWARIYISDIQEIFPGVKIQGKGLLSTEAVITIPVSEAPYPVLSVNTHFYEFKNIADEKIYLAHELEINNEYEVYIKRQRVADYIDIA